MGRKQESQMRMSKRPKRSVERWWTEDQSDPIKEVEEEEKIASTEHFSPEVPDTVM